MRIHKHERNMHNQTSKSAKHNPNEHGKHPKEAEPQKASIAHHATYQHLLVTKTPQQIKSNLILAYLILFYLILSQSSLAQPKYSNSRMIDRHLSLSVMSSTEPATVERNCTAASDEADPGSKPTLLRQNARPVENSVLYIMYGINLAWIVFTGRVTQLSWQWLERLRFAMCWVKMNATSASTISDNDTCEHNQIEFENGELSCVISWNCATMNRWMYIASHVTEIYSDQRDRKRNKTKRKKV